MLKPHHWTFASLLSLGALTLSAQDIFQDSLLEVRIEFQEENWREILIAAKNEGDELRLSSSVRINNVSYPDVQVRFKGNSSFYGAVKAGFRKVPLNLKASDEHPFAGGYETLKLANNYRDPSAVRERLAYIIASDYVPTPQSTYAIVYINDEYYGVYTATEGVSYRMTKRYFCGVKQGLVQAEPEFDRVTPAGCKKGGYANLEYLGEDARCYEGLYEVRDPSEWNELIQLARILEDSTEQIEEVLDVHLALWMHALNNTLVNLDSYLGFFCHNYYLYRDSFGIYHPLLWDLNLAFGGFHVLKEDVDIDFATLSPIVHERQNLTNRPLISSLLEDKLYRRVYFSMIRTIAEQWLLNGHYMKEAQRLHRQISPYVEKEKGTSYSFDDFQRNLHVAVKPTMRTIPGIEELMTARAAYLDKHPLLQSINLEVIRYERTVSKDSVVVKAITSDLVNTIRVWYACNDCSSFRAVHMKLMEGTNEFTREFAAPIPSCATSMYFELEGEESANLWPLNAPGGRLDVK